MSDAADNQPIRDRFRVRFAKTGLLRWIGHRDLQRLWERLLRRADLRLSMSAGFNPKPRISFPSALALGVEGLDEVVEIELAEPITAEQLQQRLAADGQPGLSIRSVQLVARFHADGTAIASFPGLGKAQVHSSEYEITLPPMIDQVERRRKGACRTEQPPAVPTRSGFGSFRVGEDRIDSSVQSATGALWAKMFTPALTSIRLAKNWP